MAVCSKPRNINQDCSKRAGVRASRAGESWGEEAGVPPAAASWGTEVASRVPVDASEAGRIVSDVVDFAAGELSGGEVTDSEAVDFMGERSSGGGVPVAADCGESSGSGKAK